MESKIFFVLLIGSTLNSSVAQNDVPDTFPKKYVQGITEGIFVNKLSSINGVNQVPNGFMLSKTVKNSLNAEPVLLEANDTSVELNCTKPTIDEFPPDLFTQDQRQKGAIVIHFLASAYIFFGIALVCDDYFVPSIQAICEALHLSSDVAGATFMAVATSAPELFTNIIGTFVTKGDLGIGTIVGSAVFNILAVCACCGLATRQKLHLEWWPLTRDCIFYFISVIILLVVLENRQVFWYEALSLVLFYIVYIFVMINNTKCKNWIEKMIFGSNSEAATHRRKSLSITEYDKLQKRKVSVTFQDASEKDQEKKPLLTGSGNLTSYNNEKISKNDEDILLASDYENELEISSEIRDEMLIAKALHENEAYAEEEQEEWGLFHPPFGGSILKWLEWIIGWPARFILYISIPDCRSERFRSWYPLTFLMCVIWIALLTYVMSWMMTTIGYTLVIPDSIVGLTLIAAGTSVPEAVSSIIVTRQGLGSMGISNSIASNTFDILICLGLPWLIRSSMLANDATSNYVRIISGGLEYSTVLLIVSLVLMYLMLSCNRFQLDHRIGFIALAMYLMFLVISSLFELNVFFPVNPPTCVS